MESCTRSHALRGNAVCDALRRLSARRAAERPGRHSHGGPWERVPVGFGEKSHVGRKNVRVRSVRVGVRCVPRADRIARERSCRKAIDTRERHDPSSIIGAACTVVLRFRRGDCSENVGLAGRPGALSWCADQRGRSSTHGREDRGNGARHRAACFARGRPWGSPTASCWPGSWSGATRRRSRP